MQSDLNLRWVYMPECMFSNIAVCIIKRPSPTYPPPHGVPIQFLFFRHLQQLCKLKMRKMRGNRRTQINFYSILVCANLKLVDCFCRAFLRRAEVNRIFCPFDISWKDVPIQIFAWHFILNENILFCLTISYQIHLSFLFLCFVLKNLP